MIDIINYSIDLLKSSKCSTKDLRIIIERLKSINIHSRYLKSALYNKSFISRAIKELEQTKDRTLRIQTAYKGKFVRSEAQEGNIRNTVLRDIKLLEKILRDLEEACITKSKEAREFKLIDPNKSKKLLIQVKILRDSMDHLKETLRSIKKYKNTNVS